MSERCSRCDTELSDDRYHVIGWRAVCDACYAAEQAFWEHELRKVVLVPQEEGMNIKIGGEAVTVSSITASVVRQTSTGYILGFVLQEQGMAFVPVINEQPGVMDIADMDFMLDIETPADTFPEAVEQVRHRTEAAWFREP